MNHNTESNKRRRRAASLALSLSFMLGENSEHTVENYIIKSIRGERK
jgi:hypothetical protein